MRVDHVPSRGSVSSTNHTELPPQVVDWSVRYIGGETGANIPAINPVYRDRFIERVFTQWTQYGRGILEQEEELRAPLTDLVDLYWRVVVRHSAVKFASTGSYAAAYRELRKAKIDSFAVEEVTKAIEDVPISGLLTQLATDINPVLVNPDGTLYFPISLLDYEEDAIKMKQMLAAVPQVRLILAASFGRSSSVSHAEVGGVNALVFNYGYKGDGISVYTSADRKRMVELGYPSQWYIDYAEVDELGCREPKLILNELVAVPGVVDMNLKRLADSHAASRGGSVGGGFKVDRPRRKTRTGNVPQMGEVKPTNEEGGKEDVSKTKLESSARSKGRTAVDDNVKG